MSLIVDNIISEGNLSGNTLFATTANLNNLVVSGGTILNSISGNTLFATSITATTYYGLQTTNDTFTTGFTYSNNTLTLSRNQGLSALTASINTMTGLTISGNLIVAGTTTLSALTGTENRMVEVSPAGIVSANSNIITGYITSGGTISNLLENTSNWDIYGNYTGTTITGTYQGQKHYDQNYLFEAVADNLFIRLSRR